MSTAPQAPTPVRPSSAFWDTPGASTSAGPPSSDSPPYINSRSPSTKPSSHSPSPSLIDPQLRSNSVDTPPHNSLLLAPVSLPYPHPASPSLPTPTPPPYQGDPGAQVQHQGGHPVPTLPPFIHPMQMSSNTYALFPAGAPPPQAPSAAAIAPSPIGRSKRSPHPRNASQALPYPSPSGARREGRNPSLEAYYAPNAALLYSHAQAQAQTMPLGASSGGRSPTGPGASVRLPPIMQVERQQVTTTATQAASASRRRNEAHFHCPVPGCGSTFTRRFNLRGHLRSHTEERPYVCEWPGCGKCFARQHDCKRHQALHTTKPQANSCGGCGKSFSRLDALNRHLRSEGGSECRQTIAAVPVLAPMPGEGQTQESEPGPLVKIEQTEVDVRRLEGKKAGKTVAKQHQSGTGSSAEETGSD